VLDEYRTLLSCFQTAAWRKTVDCAALDNEARQNSFRPMKRLTSICCILTMAAMFTLAEAADTTANPAVAEGEAAVTDAAPAAAEGEAAKEKPDIKELLALPAFTNSSGMIMVRISDKLWAGQYELTQGEYQKVAGSNPSQFQSDCNPVDSVSWNDAMSFCQKLTEVEQKEEMLPEGFTYTLPTQAQWESFAASVALKDAITGSGVSRSGTAPVGSLGPSAAGLYDVRGNVLELCLDPQDKAYRVARGAAWNSFIEVNLRPEFRWYTNGPDDRKNTIGFRCVLAPASR